MESLVEQSHCSRSQKCRGTFTLGSFSAALAPSFIQWTSLSAVAAAVCVRVLASLSIDRLCDTHATTQCMSIRQQLASISEILCILLAANAIRFLSVVYLIYCLCRLCCIRVLHLPTAFIIQQSRSQYVMCVRISVANTAGIYTHAGHTETLDHFTVWKLLRGAYKLEWYPTHTRTLNTLVFEQFFANWTLITTTTRNIQSQNNVTITGTTTESDCPSSTLNDIR